MNKKQYCLYSILLIFALTVLLLGSMFGLLVGTYKFYVKDEKAFYVTLWVVLGVTFTSMLTSWYIFRTRKVKQEEIKKKR